jgi:phosphatidylinositol alpha-1,6-mannosyltransferase
LAKNLSVLGEKVLVLAPHTERDLEFDKSQVYTVIRMRFFKNRWLRLFSRLYYGFLIANNHKIKKIYVTHWFPPGVVAILVGFVFRIPFFLATHGAEVTVPLANPLRRIARTMVLKKAAGIFSCSEFTRDIVISFDIPKKKVAYIPYGVDTEIFYPDRSFANIIRRKYGLENKKILLTVARIAWHKGHDMVIKSLPEVLKFFPETVYLIVGGDHGEKKRLENLIRESELEKYIIFLGEVPFFTKDLPMIYNACDVFIMVSKIIGNFIDVEGFGIVYAEAAACNKPLIGAKSGGIESAVINNVTGILVDPLNTEEISDALIRIFKDKEFADYLGNNARVRAIKELSWNKLIERTKKFSDSFILK